MYFGLCLGKNRVIEGPFFFKGHVVNGDRYLEMLQSYFIPQLEQLGPIDPWIEG